MYITVDDSRQPHNGIMRKRVNTGGIQVGVDEMYYWVDDDIDMVVKCFFREYVYTLSYCSILKRKERENG